MDANNVSQLLKKNSRESDIPSDDERDISPTRRSSKAKHKRKSSTLSLRENGKSKTR